MLLKYCIILMKDSPPCKLSCWWPEAFTGKILPYMSPNKKKMLKQYLIHNK